MKKLFVALFAILLISSAGYYLWVKYSPGKNIRAVSLVPSDAVYFLESVEPIRNWQEISSGTIWQYLKGHPAFGEIGRGADFLDSLIQSNQKLFNVLGSRSLLVSAHKTSPKAVDYLFIVDIGDASKMDLVKGQAENLLKLLSFDVSVVDFEGYEIRKLHDKSTRESLYISFIDNHLVCSFSGKLIEASIREKNNPVLGHDQKFMEVENRTANRGLFRLFIQYPYFDDFMKLYSDGEDEMINDLSRIMKFSGFDLKADDDRLLLDGYSNVNDSVDSYLRAILMSGNGNIGAQKVMSERSAYFLSLGFKSFDGFYQNLEKIMKQNPASWNSYKTSYDKIEKLLKINIRENFMSWIDDEICFVQNAPSGLGRDNEFVVAIHARNPEHAVKNMGIITSQIRKRTPAKFKVLDYKGYSIHYMEIKGFFKLLFGKLFARLEKPYFSFVGDYVVFSNHPETLIAMIDDHRNGRVLSETPGFRKFYDGFHSKSSVFLFVSQPKAFPLFKGFVSSKSWEGLQKHRNYITCFPQSGFQITSDDKMFATRLIMNFEKPADVFAGEEEDSFEPGADTLSEVEQFIIEQLHGNVYREYYEGDGVKLECEMEKGIMHGRYREFHENGKLKVKGKYKSGKKHGVWRYYDEEEELLRKEKFDGGDPV